MNNNGMLYPTVQAMPAGTPRDSAIATQNSSDASQNDLIRAVGGKRNRRNKRKYGGANGNITVPQFQMNYTPTGGPGQNPNSVIIDNAAISSQSASNAEYDKYATQMGGKKTKRKWGGMNPNWNWGCYSGGKKTKRNIKKRTKRRNKSRSRRKIHKK
jgi:hypothetical protein